MTRRLVDICVVLAMSLVAWATPAVAGAPSSQATDPSATSPAGVIYSIPLDSARQDAAPHGHAGQGAGPGGGGGAGPTSGGPSGSSGSGGATGSSGAGGSVAGGGTSSAVQRSGATPGTGGGGARTAAARTGARATVVLVPGGQPASLIHSANGFGSSSLVPGLTAPSGAGLDAVQGNAGSAPLLAILLAIVVVGVGGFAGARASRRETAH